MDNMLPCGNPFSLEKREKVLQPQKRKMFFCKPERTDFLGKQRMHEIFSSKVVSRGSKSALFLKEKVRHPPKERVRKNKTERKSPRRHIIQ